MEQENKDIYNLVINELTREGIWFTQKSDPTYKDAKSYYRLDKYGDPEEKTQNKIAEEVKSLIGDGASDIPEAIEVWKNDQMIEARLDFTSNLVTKFEPKPVVDNIEAYENPVQFPQSKKTEAKTKKTDGKQLVYVSELQRDTLLKVDEMCNKGMSFTDVWYALQNDGYYLKCYARNHKRGSDMPTRGMVYKDGEFSLVTIINGKDGKCSWETEGPTYYTEAKTKKTEGPGAGYDIGGIIKNVNVISFNVDKDYLENNEHFSNLPERYFVLTCDIEADVEDCEFSSYEYGSKLDFPTEVRITNLVLIDQNYDEGDDEHTEVDKDTIEEALEGASFNEVIGGGYVHTTFSGSFEAALDGSVYSDLYADKCDIEFLNAEVVSFIDKKVDGILDEVTYCVYDVNNDPIDDFENEDDAIKFAEENGYAEVVEKYHDYKLISADGSIDDNSYEDGDIVWKRNTDDEVEESKEVKTEASDYVSKYDEIDDMIDLLVSTPQEKVWLYNTFNPEAKIEKYDETTEDLFREWLETAKTENYEELRKYLDEQQAELDAYANELFGDTSELDESKNIKKEDYDVDAYNKEQEELKKQYKDRIMKSATPEIINAFNDLNDLLNNGGNIIALDGFYFPERAITVVELADKSYHLNSAMDLTTSNILNMAGNNDTFEQAIDELFADYDADSAYSWADNFVTVLSKLDFDIQEADDDYEDLEESKKELTPKEIVDWIEKTGHIKMYNQFATEREGTPIPVLLQDFYDWVNSKDAPMVGELDFIDEKKDVNFNMRTKDKINEDYQKRLQEVNNKSANVITDAMNEPDFDADSNAGKIIIRTQKLFTALSDKGLDVDVTLDNGESTSTVQLGAAGGKVVITITDAEKPLQAFISGNVEVSNDIIDGFQQIKECIKTI